MVKRLNENNIVIYDECEVLDERLFVEMETREELAWVNVEVGICVGVDLG